VNFQLLYSNDYFKCTTGYSVKTQTHPYHEIVFYGNGCNGKTIIGEKEYEFTSNNIVINQAGTPHSEIHFSDGTIRYICFTCDEFNINNGVYHNSEDLSSLFNTMTYELAHKLPNYKDMVYHEFNKLIICINRINLLNNDNEDPLISIKKFIGENCTENLSIHELADSIGYSDAHFRLLFTKKFGISPREYLIKKRCQKAIELLKFTDFNCADIALQCGFYDSSQLTKMLKNKYSTTPLNVRNQNSC